MNILGERIKEYRGDEIQGEFAKKCGVSATTLSKVENGRSRPSRKLLETIIQIKGLSSEVARELLELAGHETPVNLDVAAVAELHKALAYGALDDDIKKNLEEDVRRLIDSWQMFAEARRKQHRREWKAVGEGCDDIYKEAHRITGRLAAYALDTKAVADLHLGRVSEVHDAYARIGEYIVAANDSRIEALYNIHQGDFYRDQGAWENALAQYSLGLAYFDREDDHENARKRSAWARRKIAVVYLFQGDWMRAETLLSGCLNEFQKLDDLYEIAKTHYALGWVYNLSGDWKRANDHHHEGIKKAEKRQGQLRQDEDEYFALLGHAYLGNDLRQSGDKDDEDKAEAHLKEALRLSEKLEDQRERGWLLLGLARIYARRAIRYQKNALKADFEENDIKSRENYELAIKHFERSEAQNESIGYQYRQAMTLIHYARLELDWGNISKALMLLTKAQIITHRLGCYYYGSYINVLLCEIYLKEKRYRTIDGLVRQVENWHAQFSYFNHVARLKIIEAKAVIDQKQYSKAGAFISAAFQNAIAFHISSVEETKSEYKEILASLVGRDRKEIRERTLQHLQEWRNSESTLPDEERMKNISDLMKDLDNNIY